MTEFYLNSGVALVKGFTDQNCLLPKIKKWRKYSDEGGFCGDLLGNLPRDFFVLRHELSFAELHAHGLDFPSINLILSYLNKRTQRVTLNDIYNSWSNMFSSRTSFI